MKFELTQDQFSELLGKTYPAIAGKSLFDQAIILYFGTNPEESPSFISEDRCCKFSIESEEIHNWINCPTDGIDFQYRKWHSFFMIEDGTYWVEMPEMLQEGKNHWITEKLSLEISLILGEEPIFGDIKHQDLEDYEETDLRLHRELVRK